jgi:hypothetical protein
VACDGTQENLPTGESFCSSAADRQSEFPGGLVLQLRFSRIRARRKKGPPFFAWNLLGDLQKDRRLFSRIICQRLTA